MSDAHIKAVIEAGIKRHGYTAQEWRHGDDGLEAVIGRAAVLESDEDAGLFSGVEGELTACVVGAERYHNERVCFALQEDGMNYGPEVDPHNVELL